jgi:hypothetical protein
MMTNSFSSLREEISTLGAPRFYVAAVSDQCPLLLLGPLRVIFSSTVFPQHQHACMLLPWGRMICEKTTDANCEAVDWGCAGCATNLNFLRKGQPKNKNQKII